jgi:RNA polymerase sigma factor (TIGR02999 family)
MTRHHVNSEHDSLPTESTLTAGEGGQVSEITGDGQTITETITVLLSRINQGDRDAFDQLVPLVYHELHRIADGYLRRESRNHTLQPTALIHEAWLRLAGSTGADYQNRKHFYATAAKVMRRILVDHARARATGKRDASLTVALEAAGIARAPDRIVISLDDALNALAAQDERKARFVEMRFFGGMTAEEIAECAATPVHIVRRELRAAQIWLRREIGV